MYITPQTIITVGAVLGALTAVVTLYNKILRWVDHQSAQDAALEKLKEEHRRDIDKVCTELSVVVSGLLSCLKGLQEQGCNGPVTEGIKKLENHLNKCAHEHREN